MKLFKPSLVVAVAATFVGGYAQIVTPGAGPVRKAIMDGLRPSVQRIIGIPVEFKVYQLDVYHGWAFVRVEPLQKNGRAINYMKTRERKEAMEDGGNFSTECAGLLRQSGKHWGVVKFWHGYSDVAWWGIWDKYGLPQAMFSPLAGG